LIEDRPPDGTRRRIDRSPEQAEKFRKDGAPCKIVLSLREDYLAALEELAHDYPSLRHNRMILRPMNGLQARDVILKPGEGLVAPAVVPQILRLVSGERGGFDPTLKGAALENSLGRVQIDPPLLSLFCRELNNRRRKLQEETGQRAKIDARMVSEDTGREILQSFYEECWTGLPAEVRPWLEDNLVTEDGYRDSVAIANVLTVAGFTEEVIDALVKRRLLRCEEDEHLGVRRLELTHDVLLSLVKTSRDVRQEREARARQLEEAKVAAERAAKEAEAAERRAAQEKAETEAREQQRQLELEQARKRAVRARVFAFFFALVASAAIALGLKTGRLGSALTSKEAELQKALVGLEEKNHELEKRAKVLDAKNAALKKAQQETDAERQKTADALIVAEKARDEAKHAEATAVVARHEAEVALQRSVEAFRQTARAGQDTIDLVLSEDVGLPPKGAQRLLNSAEKLYAGFSPEDVKRVPEAIKGRAHLQLAKGQLYLDDASTELGKDRFEKAKQASDGCQKLSAQLASIAGQEVIAKELLARAYLLEGDVAYRKADVFYYLPRADRPPQAKDLTEVYVSALESYKKSAHTLEELKEDATKAGKPTVAISLELIRVHQRLGDAQRRTGEEIGLRNQHRVEEQFDAAEIHYRAALELSEYLNKNANEEDRSQIRDALAESHNKLANILSMRWNYFGKDRPDSALLSTAQREYRKALEIRKELVEQNRDSPQLQRQYALTTGNLAGVLVEQRNLPEARKYLDARIDIDRNLYLSDPGNLHWRKALAEGYFNLARNLEKRFHDPQAALAPARQATLLSQERNRGHLKLYLRLVTDPAEKKRVTEVLAKLPQDPLEASTEAQGGPPPDIAAPETSPDSPKPSANSKKRR
jgi:hypothetical protein